MLKLSSENIEKLKKLKENGLVSNDNKDKKSLKNFNSISSQGFHGIFLDDIGSSNLDSFFEALDLINPEER